MYLISPPRDLEAKFSRTNFEILYYFSKHRCSSSLLLTVGTCHWSLQWQFFEFCKGFLLDDCERQVLSRTACEYKIDSAFCEYNYNQKRSDEKRIWSRLIISTTLLWVYEHHALKKFISYIPGKIVVIALNNLLVVQNL